MPVDDRDWDQHHREVRHRLSWTGLIANGAPIIAILGGAAQSDTFLAVIDAMTVPMVLFGVGAAGGLIAEEISLKADIEWKQGSAWWENDEGPAKEIARINVRLREMQADGSIVKPENAAKVLRLTSRTKDLISTVQDQGSTATKRVRKSIKLNHIATVVRWFSLVLCACGFATILMSA